MQQFVVPQFIDVEDKILGPITVRQFIIILVGAGFIFVAYKLADFALFILEFVFISTLSFAIAFLKINGRPIHYFLLNFIQTLQRPKIRVWNKIISRISGKSSKKDEDDVAVTEVFKKNKVRASRLAEMSLIVDTGGVYQGEKEPPNIPNVLV